MKKLSCIFGLLSIFFMIASCSDSRQKPRLVTHVLQGPSPFKSDLFSLSLYGEEGFKYIFKHNKKLFEIVDDLQESDPLIIFNESDQTYYKFIGKSGDTISLPWGYPDK